MLQVASLASITLVLSWAGSTPAQHPDLARYEIGFADGSRKIAQRISTWSPELPSLKLDEHDLWQADPPLRWIRDREAELPGAVTAWVETWTGDRLPGQVLRYGAQLQVGGTSMPAHLLVRSVTSSFPPHPESPAEIRIRLRCVRRVVWQDAGRDYEPGTAILRDGRQVNFRAVRWSADSVTLLTDESRRSLALADVAELNLPAQSPWEAWLDELAVLAPHGTGQLLQIETAQGVIATTSWPRQRMVKSPADAQGDQFLHGVQPAWSLDMLWLPGSGESIRRFFQPHEVPLSRIPPTQVVQRSPLAQQGRPWQRDRNVEGGWLMSGPGTFGWGFGVHAHNELHFLLPDYATSFSGFVGLDALAAAAGCVQARVVLQSPDTQLLFETPLIIGAQQVYATGLRPLAATASPTAAPRRLVLAVDYAHQSRPPGADPLDIRDSADWLDPLLNLDPVVLTDKLTAETASHMDACRGWQWRTPEGTQLHFRSVWDELSGSASRFALGVAVAGSQPLSLVKRQSWDDSPQQLVLTVSCPLKTQPPVRIEVLAAGEQLAAFDVPPLDRDHLNLTPQVVSLRGVKPRPDGTVDCEIRQYPGSLAAPVQWHAIQFTAADP